MDEALELAKAAGRSAEAAPRASKSFDAETKHAAERNVSIQVFIVAGKASGERSLAQPSH